MTNYNTRETLLERIKDQSDEYAWEEFVHFYEKFIYSIIRKMGISVGASEDITQDVMLKLWKSLPDFDYDNEKGGFRYWLYRVTVNTVQNHLRKEARHQEKLNKELQSVQAVEPFLKQSPEMNKWIEREWKLHISNLAYENIKPSLSEKAQTVFSMYLKEVPTAEIAETIGMNESNVYLYTSRIKDKLLKEIKRLRSELE